MQQTSLEGQSCGSHCAGPGHAWALSKGPAHLVGTLGLCSEKEAEVEEEQVACPGQPAEAWCLHPRLFPASKRLQRVV